MDIRKVNIQEIDKLRKIGKLTFVETFSSGNSAENIDEYLENEFSKEKLTAELDGKQIGYLKIYIVQSQT